MSSKIGSLEEKVKLPPTETVSRCYQSPQGNRKVIRILTVAVYVLAVSLAAIMLSLYYIFIWDPTIRPFVSKTNNCEKIVIPEKIAIRLLNSSEVTADQFYKHILEQYRILNQLQQQRQLFLQKQHLQLQKLAAGNKFQEIFATATIIQAHSNDRASKPVTPTNGTFLLDPKHLPPPQPLLTTPPTPAGDVSVAEIPAADFMSIKDPPPLVHSRRKTHRKHYNHHRHNIRRGHKQALPFTTLGTPFNGIAENARRDDGGGEVDDAAIDGGTHLAPPLNAPMLTSQVLQQRALLEHSSPAAAIAHMQPIPLILNSKEDTKRPHHLHGGEKKAAALARKRTAAIMSNIGVANSAVANSDAADYMHPFLTGELIFEK